MRGGFPAAYGYYLATCKSPPLAGVPSFAVPKAPPTQEQPGPDRRARRWEGTAAGCEDNDAVRLDDHGRDQARGCCLDARWGQHRVIGVYPQGKKPIYRLHFKDGRWADACGEHLWKVYGPHLGTGKGRCKSWKVISTDALARRLTGTRARWKVPVTKPVEVASPAAAR